MAIEKLTQNVEVIQTLSDYPNTDQDLTAADLKRKFDEGSSIIKAYLNDTIVPEINRCGNKLQNQTCLFVTLTSDNTASHTAEQVYAHIKNGGSAVLRISDGYLPLSCANSAYAKFEAYEPENDTKLVYRIGEDGSIAIAEDTIASTSYVKRIVDEAMLIVTLNDDGTADISADQIYAHIQNHGNAQLLSDGRYMPLTYSNSSLAVFTLVMTTGEVFSYRIDADRKYTFEETDYVDRTALDNEIDHRLNVQEVPIVNKLCPTFSESGTAVRCEPVEGYPLSVVSHIEPVQEGSGDPSPESWGEAENALVKSDMGDIAVSTISGNKYRLIVNVNDTNGERAKLSDASVFLNSDPGYPFVDIIVRDYEIEFDGDSSYEMVVDLWFQSEVDKANLFDVNDNQDGTTITLKDGVFTLLEAPGTIRPISGRSAVKLWRGGKNILDTKNPKVLHNNAYEQSFNVVVNDTGFRASAIREYNNCWSRLGYIIGTTAELAGKTITVSAKYNSLVSKAEHIPYIQFAATDIEPCSDNSNIVYGNGGYIGNDGAYKALAGGNLNEKTISYTITGNEGKKYFFITFAFSYGGSFAADDWIEYSDIQVEIGDTATTYEPYRGETFTIDLGQDVYGGSLDWNSGVLTIDRVIHTLDGSEVWGEANTASTSQDSRRRYALYASKNRFLQNSALAHNASDVDGKLLCSKLPTVTASDTYYHTDGICSLCRGQSNEIYGYCDQYATDFEGFKAAMIGAQIVFGLKEPITVQLTPQEILALSGVNTLYSDTGDTTVSGKADPVAIIEDLKTRLATLEAAIVNNV